MMKVFSNHFSAISGRLKLVNSLAALLFLVACQKGVYWLPDTEMICPNGNIYIIKFSKQKDVAEAIREAFITKKLNKTSEQYTALKFSDKRSLRLERLSPEDAVNCKLRETEYQAVGKEYIYGN
jgi:hypothetical protein